MAEQSLGYSSRLPGACGVNHLSGFVYRERRVRKSKNDWWSDTAYPVEQLQRGGCDWVSAGFINDFRCRKAYEALTAKYGAPVFQTPVRMNRNSLNRFFYAMWDTRKKRTRKAA